VLGPGEEGLEWFFEGFTDYLSLWHLASLGRITPQEFVDRLRFLDLLLHESPAAERVAFADRAVNWREPDAETVAYKGGALLAFHLDAALRASGAPGLPQLFRDLCHGERATYTLAGLREWVVTQGLEEFWRAHVEGIGLPAIEDALVRIGCSERSEGASRILEVKDGALASFLRFEPTSR
jgi:predicted metalloprotease with PDZ domain